MAPPGQAKACDFLDTMLRSTYTTPNAPSGIQRYIPRARPYLWWGLALLALAAGYADLIRGGETIAPILLVLGYCVLVPIAILK